jgi:small subunit ribosomal protein S4
VSVVEKSRASQYFKDALGWAKTQARPAWLETDPETLTARVLSAPERGQIEAQVDTQLIVEHYSR